MRSMSPSNNLRSQFGVIFSFFLVRQVPMVKRMDVKREKAPTAMVFIIWYVGNA